MKKFKDLEVGDFIFRQNNKTDTLLKIIYIQYYRDGDISFSLLDKSGQVTYLEVKGTDEIMWLCYYEGYMYISDPEQHIKNLSSELENDTHFQTDEMILLLNRLHNAEKQLQEI